MKGSAIHWFQKGLRLHDNPSLMAAVTSAKTNGLTLRPVYIFDPWYTENTKIGVNQYRFLLQSLCDLDNSLRKLGSRLFVLHGNPKDVLSSYFKKWKTQFIAWESELEPHSIERDEGIRILALSMSIEVSVHIGRTLFDPCAIIDENDGEVPLTYKKFIDIISSMDPPVKPSETLMLIPEACNISNVDSSSEEYSLPTLKYLSGIDDTDLETSKFLGGETEGLRRLEDKLSMLGGSSSDSEYSTTELSPYLSLGCVSPRTVYWKVHDLKKEVHPSKYLGAQLFWREFFHCVGTVIPNFDKMEDNKICLQVAWHNDLSKIQAWREGKTGYPYIDAIMTQLRDEGWIGYTARQVTACFLTRGTLWQSWEEGKDIFAEYLIDYDWFLNTAHWLRQSASAFFHRYFLVYSPIAFGKKRDPNGDYIKKYIPELKEFPSEYIYAPWEAPVDIQEAASCIIGIDYPKPIVNHAAASKQNKNKMKTAYGKKRGKAPGVKRKIETRSSKEPNEKVEKLYNSARGRTSTTIATV